MESRLVVARGQVAGGPTTKGIEKLREIELF